MENFRLQFKRATVQNYKTGELETANYRISKTAWLKRTDHDTIEKIYQRVGDVTGLNMETSEELQVSNYGIGGHYEPHFDFARVKSHKIYFSKISLAYLFLRSGKRRTRSPAWGRATGSRRGSSTSPTSTRAAPPSSHIWASLCGPRRARPSSGTTSTRTGRETS